MSYCEGNALTLDVLPSDIIRVIIRMELSDSFESMRLISQRWNCIGIDYLRDRIRLPAIDGLNLCVEPEGETMYYFNMRVANECLRFLGLHNCKSDLYLSDFSTSVIAFDRVFTAPLTKKWFLNRTSLLFNRCSRIDKFDFSNFGFDTKELKLDTIIHVFGDIAIRELSIASLYKLTSIFERNIINIVRALSVHRLVIIIGVLRNQLPIDVFRSHIGFFISIVSEAAANVDSIDLKTSYRRPSGWDEASETSEWEKYAGDLSAMANVSVIFKMQKEDEEIRFTMTARKHAE